jgi:predicted phage terminase large subunit-like protein
MRILRQDLTIDTAELETSFNKLDRDAIASRFTGVKRTIVEGLCDGDNFYSLSKQLGIDHNRIYKIRDELKMDLSFIYDEAAKNKYLDVNRGVIGEMAENLATMTRTMPLSMFSYLYINEYNPEAVEKHWKRVPLQDRYEKIWKTYSKSIIKAPREHLKTTSVCEFIVKTIFERQYPLEIIYFHLNENIAIEKVRNIQLMAERNQIISAGFMIDQARNWKDGSMRLLDGTTVTAAGYLTGVVGKHPHIIICDDVIDQRVIYSDQLNDKAIRKFYSDVYPMITKTGDDKKIIMIGTAQREDDLYERLPSDFHKTTLQAITDEATHKVLEPNLFTWDDLMKVKSDMTEQFGDRYWLKEYMNVPLTAMGEIIKPEWIQYYHDLPEDLDIFQGWDLSVGKDVDEGDWTAGVTIGVKRDGETTNIYIIDVFRARIEFAERLKAIDSKAKEFSPQAVGVEQNVFQYDTVSTLQRQTNHPIVGIKTIKNKIEKFRVDLAPHFENRKVYINPEIDQEFVNELLSLPYGKHDDMVDAATIAIKLSGQYVGEPSIDFL